MNDYKTEQEAFWAGDFGDNYADRNSGGDLIAANISFFAKALARSVEVRSCIEFGANIGLNLQALKLLFPNQEQFAVEINQKAAAELRKKLPAKNVFENSILDFKVVRGFDLVLIKGVLIHINPASLPDVYDLIYSAIGRYLLIAEYYSPSPVEVAYRGHMGRLFKRDFAGEIMDRHPDLRLTDYGFVYRRDACFPQDDITWFLMEKR